MFNQQINSDASANKCRLTSRLRFFGSLDSVIALHSWEWKMERALGNWFGFLLKKKKTNWGTFFPFSCSNGFVCCLYFCCQFHHSPTWARVHRFRYFFTSTFAHIPLSSGRYGLPYKSVRFLYCFPPFPLSLHERSWYSFLLLVTPSFYTLFMYKQRHIQFCNNFVNVFVCTSNFVCSLKALTMTRCRKL